MNPAPAPPYGRLLEDKHLQGPARIALQVRRAGLNPFVLKARAEQLLTEIWRQQNAFAASQTGDATIGENAPPSEAPARLRAS